MSVAGPLAPDTVLRNYFRAKDENRPHLLADVFTPDARLEVINRASTIALPALTVGREAIADVLVRRFGQSYENVYSFYMEQPAPAAPSFACDWLVVMSEKDGGNVRVGCGRYDWQFEQAAPSLAARLVITIEAMQVLSPSAFERTFEWLRQLSYPWSCAAAVMASAPGTEMLAPVLQYLGRHVARS